MRIGFSNDGSVGTIVKSAWSETEHKGVRVMRRTRKGGGGVTALPIIGTYVAAARDFFPGDDDDDFADRAKGVAESMGAALASIETGVGTVNGSTLMLRLSEGRNEKGEATFAYSVGRGKSGGKSLTLDGPDPISVALRAFAYAAHVA